jgi:hypothetical protein
MGRFESRIVGAFIAVLVPSRCFFAAWWLCVGAAHVAVGWPALVLCRYRLATKAATAAYGGHSRVAQTA